MGKLIVALVALGLLIYMVVSFFREDSSDIPSDTLQPAGPQTEVFELKDNLGHVTIQKDYFDMPIKKTISEEPAIPDKDILDFYSKEIEPQEEQ